MLGAAKVATFAKLAALPAPTYAVAAAGGATSVNEGSSLTFNVTGTNIVNGTYYFTVTNSGDFATSSGSFTITSNAGSFSVTPTADVTTEGAETFTASVRTGSTGGTIVATSASITINDTSLTPLPEEWYFSTSVGYGTPTEMSIDHTGNYIAVASSNSSGSQTLLLDKNGVKQWHKSNTHSGGFLFTMNSVKVTSGGTVYIGGGFSANASDNYIEKIALDGTLQWHRRWGSANAEGTTQIQNIHIDASENIHICGVDRSTSTQTGWAVGKIATGTTSPTLTWGQRFYGSSTSSGSQGPGDGSHIAVDSSGNVYAAGYFGTNAGYQAVGKWNSSGTHQLVRAVSGVSTGIRVQGLGIDSSSNLYWILASSAATAWPVQTASITGSNQAGVYKITNLTNLSGSYLNPPHRAFNQRNAKVKNDKIWYPSMSMGDSANEPGWMSTNCSDGSYSRDYKVSRTSGTGTFKLSDISSSDDGTYVVFCGRVSGADDGNGTEADVVVRVSATTGTKTFTVKGGTYSIIFNNFGGTGTGSNWGTDSTPRMFAAVAGMSFNTSGFTLTLANLSVSTAVTTTL
jgi:hypothetical protein